MLLYYFGSGEQLWDALVARLQERDQLALLGDAKDGRVRLIEDVWSELSSPRQLPVTRLIFELYGRALREPERYAGFLKQIVDGWLDVIARALHAQHRISRAEARVQARMRLALMRGLLLDLLTTGDRKGTTAAMHTFARALRLERRATGKRQPRKMSKR
jgi:AcrR family transcriptional regulator